MKVGGGGGGGGGEKVVWCLVGEPLKAAFGGYVKVSALDDLRCALSCLSL